MERDFLGIGGNDSGAKDSWSGRLDSAFSVVQWPLYNNKASSMQQFKSFNTQQVEKHKNAFVDLISSNSSNPIGSFAATSSKACAVQTPQISLSLDRHNLQHFAIHNYQNHDMDNCCASTHLVPVSPTSIPTGMSSPLFKIHGSSNGTNLTVTAVKPQPFRPAKDGSLLGAGTAGSFTSWNVVKSPPNTAQLTIFYAGSVNVYDVVDWDKAQAVMLLASEGCKATSNVVHSMVEEPAPPLDKGSSLSDSLRVSQTQKTVNNHAVSPCSGLSGTLALASCKGDHSERGSMSTTDGRVGKKGIGTSQDEASMAMKSSMVAATAAAATTMLRGAAVPQARKASLARFLEKRKERVSNTMPYSFEKMPSEIAPGVAIPFSNCSVPQASLPIKQEFSWFKGQAKKCDDNGNGASSPSTKLEM